jgi:hypothetical protein
LSTPLRHLSVPPRKRPDSTKQLTHLLCPAVTCSIRSTASLTSGGSISTRPTNRSLTPYFCNRSLRRQLHGVYRRVSSQTLQVPAHSPMLTQLEQPRPSETHERFHLVGRAGEVVNGESVDCHCADIQLEADLERLKGGDGVSTDYWSLALRARLDSLSGATGTHPNDLQPRACPFPWHTAYCHPSQSRHGGAAAREKVEQEGGREGVQAVQHRREDRMRRGHR